MGLWPDELDEEARLAAEGEYEKVGEKLKRTRVNVGEGQTLKSMRLEWGKTHAGRSV